MLAYGDKLAPHLSLASTIGEWAARSAPLIAVICVGGVGDIGTEASDSFSDACEPAGASSIGVDAGATPDDARAACISRQRQVKFPPATR